MHIFGSCISFLIFFCFSRLVPYGKIEQVLPYLVRRAQENSDVMQGVEKERGFFFQELCRRLFSEKTRLSPTVNKAL